MRTQGMNGCEKRVCRILVVDDDEPIRILFKRIVTDRYPGVEVDMASDGVEAMKCYEQHRHAIIVTDLCMPNLDGLGVWRAVRESCGSRGEPVPYVVFCTGFAPPKWMENVLAQSAKNRLLLKPVKVETLGGLLDPMVTAVTGWRPGL